MLSMFDVKTEWKRERENVITNVITFSTATKKMFSIYFPSYRLCGTSIVPQLENMFHGRHMCAILLLLTHM